jgi:DNA-binding response OmpR family regulator
MNDKAPRVLLVEDDARIRGEMETALREEGCEVTTVESAALARAALSARFEVVLLDLGLPDGDGLDICRALREEGRDVPVIVVTARDAPERRVEGLDAGADDYVVKPFHMDELKARVRSVLRRSSRTVVDGRVTCGDLWADARSRRVGRGERELHLKPREFDLLLYLLRHPGRAWTRDQLLDRVWGLEEAGDTRTVDLHVRRLRVKVEDDPGDPRFIETVWGVGYRMNDQI